LAFPRAVDAHGMVAWRLPLPAGWDWLGGCCFVGDGDGRDERDVDLPCPESRHAATARRAWKPRGEGNGVPKPEVKKHR
jgi:hypothetical protein